MPTLDACGVLIGDYCSHIEMDGKQSQPTARWRFALENVNTKAIQMNLIMWLSFLLFSLKRSLPHNYIHLHSIFVHIWKDQHKQL